MTTLHSRIRLAVLVVLTSGFLTAVRAQTPAKATTRGQMAPFLVKTFGLLLYGP